MLCIFYTQVATPAGQRSTGGYPYIACYPYNCYRCHFPEGRNFSRNFPKSPRPTQPCLQVCNCKYQHHTIIHECHVKECELHASQTASEDFLQGRQSSCSSQPLPQGMLRLVSDLQTLLATKKQLEF